MNAFGFRLAALGLAVLACRPSTSPSPEGAESRKPRAERREPKAALPPIPLVEGTLEPRIVYPQANQMIQSKDSTFFLGSVGNGKATATVNGQPVEVKPNGAIIAWVPNPPPTAPQYELVATLGADTARATQQVRVAGMLPPDTTKPPTVTDTTPTWVVLGDSVAIATDTDRVVIARPGPTETYRWFFFPGTRALLTARFPGYARVRVDSALQVWVPAADAKTLATDTVPPKRVTQNARVRADAGWSDLIIPMGERPTYLVEEGNRYIDVTLYDTRSNTDVINYPTNDSLITHVEWNQERSDRVKFRVYLSQQPFGYLVLFDNNAFVLRVRRRPGYNGKGPVLATGGSSLTDLTIAIDPGHPPAGATGPTGLYEADAALAVGMALKRILEERGANVVMTRTTRDAVDLGMRPVIARRANAHALVSLHYNAYGDGVNPLTKPNGVEVYFYRPQAEPLARAVQSALVAYQPLADQGVYYRSLAIARTTWMPSVLAEGGFIIIPEQENAMRTPEFQERYARGVADGLEAYFRLLRSQ